MNRITLVGIAAALLMLSCSTARDARTGLRDSLERMMERELDLPAAASFEPADGSFGATASGQLGADLQELGLTDPEQVKGTRRVLTAAALTYVAAAATSVAYIATLWMMSQGRRGLG